jgi:acetoin utilization protein AcuC
MGLLGTSERFEEAPGPATREELESFHTPRYLDTLKAADGGHLDASGLFMGLGTEDCPVWRGMYDYAALACGATLTGARLLAEGRAGVAFNPSGGYHHAGPEKAAGFCYVNDVVIGAMDLAARGLRVFVLDVDVHHGDGTQDAFYARSDVMTMSFHESGRTLFPGRGFVGEIGIEGGRGFNVNVPLPAGTYDAAYMRAFRELAMPLLGAFGPDLILLELGMDGLSGDPLAHLSLTNNAYADLTELVNEAGPPVLAVGGGGYNVQSTARGWALVWSVLCGAEQGAETDHALGGVMLESTDWQGGLRDRALRPDDEQVRSVEPQVEAVIEAVKATVFPLHGL